MNRLYVLVGPSFSGMSQFVNEILGPTTENLQIVEESTISQAQKMEDIQTDSNTLYGIIATIVRAHLLKNRNVVARCENLSIDTLVMWKRMSEDHGAQCVIIMFDSDFEESINKINNLPVTEDTKQLMRMRLNLQFKRYEDLRSILIDKLNTITRDLADVVLKEEEYFDKSQEG